MSYLFAPNEETLGRACKDIGVPRQRFDEDVQIIREWLSMQPHLPTISENSLLCENMLLRCKGSIELTKKAIDFNLSMRTIFPEFFGVRDPLGDDIQHLLDIWTNSPLPQLTSEGFRVKMFLLSSQENVSTHEMNTVVKLWMMLSDLEMKEDVNLGEVYIHDMASLGLAHVIRLTPTFVQNAFEVGANGCKARIKSIHLLNSPPVVEKLMKILMTFLPKKVAGRFYVHPDVESLHKYIDKAILPKDYGGDQKPLAELARDWREKIGTYRDWFLQQDASGKVDESKRPQRDSGNKGDLFGYQGTFKKLQVD